MKKLSFTLVFYFFIFLSSYSQRLHTMIDLGDLAVRTSHSHNEWLNNGNNSTTEGSMYLHDDFRLGSMVLKSDTLVEGIKYRFNIYTKQMEMFFNNDTLALVKPEKVKNIYFDSKSFIYTGFEENEKVEMGYFQVLAEGECNLLLHYKVVFVPKSPPPTPLSPGNPNDQFVQFKYYFYQKGDNLAMLLSQKSKKILSLLADKKTEMDKYIKEKKLKTNDDKDLVEIFRYYNSLK